MKVSISWFPSIVLHLFEIRTVVHVHHLRTTSKSQHDALKEFYENIVPLTDRFAELAIAKFPEQSWPACVESLLELDTPITVVLDALQAMLDDLHGSIMQEDLKSILVEMSELTNSTLYKLRLN